ncbi:MAG: tRNA lysidine(34) synthetase TilS [Dehalococcoidia bacterium]
MAAELPSNRRTSAFERRVARALGRVEGGVLVAVSGGADSTATLIAAARALGPERVTAGHFDHRLRTPAEAARDFDAVRDIARRLGVLVSAGRAARRPVDRSEAAAREARYRWLARACRQAGATTCVTGHTLDDQAETVLLRLVRGSGALGAAGMRADAEWPVPGRGTRGLRLLRPLLGVTREEVEDYLAALGVEAVEDASNASEAFARNRIRREVMPALRGLNARAAEHLAEFAASQRDDDAALSGIAREWLAAHGDVAAGEGASVVTIARQGLRELPLALRIRVIREAAGRIGLSLEAAHLRAIDASLEKTGGIVDLPLARSRASGSLLELRTRPSPSGTD